MQPRLDRGLVAVVIALASTSSAAFTQLTPFEMEVNAWTHAVRQHQPGSLDDHATRLGAMPWLTLGPILEQTRRKGDPELQLLAASMLLDVAVHIPLEQRPQKRDLGLAMLTEDGERRGTVALDPHIWVARQLVDAAVANAGRPHYTEMRPRAIAWYRTVTAVLASGNNLADLEPHIRQSLRKFPDDAGVVFDAGTYAESFAAPMVQAAMFRREDSSRRTKPIESLRAGAILRQALLADAEKHYRRALDLDPAHTEAVVRLGRVLTMRGRSDAAVIELHRAVLMPASSVVRYFAFLFLGNALERANDPSGAAGAFREAATLFPDAQSPQLALSRLAAERGESRESHDTIERLLSRRTHADGSDPWWFYHRGRGRDVESIYREFVMNMRQMSVSSRAAERQP
ncbi:MAG TPA: tetratricopeptide repeat protein [Vicinamibacterales bacterium]|nr:tetratricopeptide repeat protein [Vicinamibacterales bacterium]